MIHFFPRFADDPSDSPFAQELRRAGVDHRLFGQALSFHYKHRLGLILLGWPRLMLFACRSAWRSLVESKPAPDVVVLDSHLEVIVFGLARLLLPRRRRPAIVLLGFIYTPRENPVLRLLREAYFRFIFRIADKMICHSSAEMHRYGQTFAAAKAKFRFIPYGMYVAGEESYALDNPVSGAAAEFSYLLAAGRSGRDYATLIAAVDNDRIPTHVVCDRKAALEGLAVPAHLKILSRCYGDDYLEELKNAAIVVIPLAVDNISAGQMALIQAMAYRKPIVVTRTSTIQEYVRDGKECLLVERNDSASMANALRRLMSDEGLAKGLADGARRAYDQRFGVRAWVNNVIAVCRST